MIFFVDEVNDDVTIGFWKPCSPIYTCLMKSTHRFIANNWTIVCWSCQRNLISSWYFKMFFFYIDIQCLYVFIPNIFAVLSNLHLNIGYMAMKLDKCVTLIGPRGRLGSVAVPGAKTMMTSSNGNIFRVTGHLCGEFTGHRWIPRTKASDAELWFFF